MAFCYGCSIVGTSGVNGDSYYMSPDHTTIMLADGASGAGREGKVLMSQHCAKVIKDNPFVGSGLKAERYLETMIWTINNDLIAISQQRKARTFGTLIIGVIHDQIATIASVGDSMAFHLHDNLVVRVAKTHKTYQNLIDAGLFTDEQAERHIHGLPDTMWSMFDTFMPAVVPDYAMESIKLHAGDMIGLCCDGVSDHIALEEIPIYLKYEDAAGSMETIMETARERSIKAKQRLHHDDITMIVYGH